jgi:site-specific recombinase XerD
MGLVPLPRLKKDKNIVHMNHAEVRSLLDAVEIGNASMSERQRKICEKTKQRDYAILFLMLNTGIRVSECNGLDINDVDLKANTLTIVRKGGGQDILYFGDGIRDALETYIEGERTLITPIEGHESALFYSLQGKRISVDAIENLVKKYARIAVPNKKITPHKLRSTYGTNLYHRTNDIFVVAEALGHRDVNTTKKHYAAMSEEILKEAARVTILRDENSDEE